MCRNIKLFTVLNLFSASVGTIIGIAGFIAFLFYYDNYNAALWSLISGIFALCCLHLHVLYLRKKICDWYTVKHLESIQSFGLVIFLSSVVAFGIYISLAIVREQNYTLENFSFFPVSTFVALNLYWSFCLFFFSHLYQKKIMANNPALLSGVRVYPGSDF